MQIGTKINCHCLCLCVSFSFALFFSLSLCLFVSLIMFLSETNQIKNVPSDVCSKTISTCEMCVGRHNLVNQNDKIVFRMNWVELSWADSPILDGI